MQEISPKALKALMDEGDTQIVDVREPWELEICQIAGSQNIPLGTVPGNVEQLDKTRPIVAVCHHGMRSAQAGMYWSQLGFEVLNLTGGIDAWAREVDSNMDTY